MKKIISCILVITLTAAGILLWYGTEMRKDLSDQICFRVGHDGQTDIISLWKAEGEASYYLFLPSYAKLSDVAIETADHREITVGDWTLQSGQSLAELTEQETCSLRYGHTTGSFTILRSANTAALFIDTKNDSLESVNADKTNTAKVNVEIYSAEGAVVYQSDSAYNGKFHGRGNSTWRCAKKPYRLKLPNSVDLFGMGASRKWVLLANAYDETQMRNKLVYDFAAQLGTLWAPDSVYVDLYADGQYLGLYQLTEAMEVSESRLNISEDAILFLANYENHWDADSIGFCTGSGKSIELADSSAAMENQAAALRDRLNALEKAIEEQDVPLLESLIDFDSWADLYLTFEVFLNGEMELNSCYFWWDSSGDGLIHAGPVWDYDLSLGNDNSLWTTAYSDPTMLLASDEMYTWFPGLLETEAFREKVLSHYQNVFRPLLAQLTESVLPRLEDTISSARAMDDIRWKGKLVKTSEDSAAATDRMREFLEQRIRFLDDYLTADEGTALPLPNSQASAVKQYLQKARIIFQEYGSVLCTLGLFGITGIILILIYWKRKNRRRKCGAE